MLDLHLFLGRKPHNVYDSGKGLETRDGEGDEGLGDEQKAPQGYEMSDLNPDLVHYGNLPQQVSGALLAALLVLWPYGMGLGCGAPFPTRVLRCA